MIAAFLSNHDPHVSYDDLEIMEGYCGEWNSHFSGLKPKKQLGHKKELGRPVFWKEGSMGNKPWKKESWVIPSIAEEMSDTRD